MTPTSYKLKRVALVGCVLTSCLLFTGLIFGWAPLLLMLQEEHQYAELCDGGTSCVAQENQLNLMFAIASVAANIGALPFGVFLDYCGPKVALTIGAVVEISGLVLMALADSQTFDVFVPGYTLLAFGGSITMMSSFPASFLMIEDQTAILAAISCLFDGSSVIFLVLYSIRSAYDISRQQLFFALAAGASVLYVLLIVLWHVNEQDLVEDSHMRVPGENTFLLPVFEDIDIEPSPNTTSPIKYKRREIEALHLTDRPLRDQIFTFEYGYIAIFAFVQVLRATMFIGTINKLLDNYGDVKYGFLQTQVFSFVLPLGFLFVPAIDHIVERQGLSTSLIVTNGLGVLANVMQLIPSLELQCVTFFVFTSFRAFLYAVMSAFIAKTFGLKTMGTLAGLMFSLSSIIGLLEYPAVTLSNTYLDGDLMFVNVICLALVLMLFPLTNLYCKREQARVDQLRLLNALVDSELSVKHGIAYLRSPCRKSPLRLVQ